MSEVEATGASPTQYGHQGLMEELATLNHQLDEMKETMMTTSVRAHILEAEIASLFDPEVEEELRKVTEASESCEKAINGKEEK